MSARLAKERLCWIVQADRIRVMGEHLRRRNIVWWVPLGLEIAGDSRARVLEPAR